MHKLHDTETYIIYTNATKSCRPWRHAQEESLPYRTALSDSEHSMCISVCNAIAKQLLLLL